ncbi:MAG TPA: sulfur carrier protein ThiS [Stellaceae bacterium]
MSAPIRVNGEAEPFPGGTVAALIAARGIASRRGLAVALNGTVVPARHWDETILSPGDEVEIVRPFGGG